MNGDDRAQVPHQRQPAALEVDATTWTDHVWATDFSLRPNEPLCTPGVKLFTMTADLPKSVEWARLFADATLDVGRRLAADRRRYMSGPDRFERKIARLYGIPPHLLGLAPPPLAIDGAAYRRRQRNRVKRKRR